MGTPLKSPFMTLSFMALIVIPTLKIGEKGIFDFEKFDFVKQYMAEDEFGLKEKVSKLPTTPGVYQFFDANGVIILQVRLRI